MTVPADKTYPANATNSAWQKKKSFTDKAKAKTKTGLGADLDSALTHWNAIKWAALDAATLNAQTVSVAKQQLANAKAARLIVDQAEAALDKARLTAKATATNKYLSSSAKAAANTIAGDLDKAIKRLKTVKVGEFDLVVTRLEDAEQTRLNKLKDAELIQLTKIKIEIKTPRKEIATAQSGTWDRKLFKAANVVWTVGTANDYQGKVLIVSGEIQSNESGLGLSRDFNNDMKLDSTNGSNAAFKE